MFTTKLSKWGAISLNTKSVSNIDVNVKRKITNQTKYI